MTFKELLTKQIESYKPDWQIPHILLAIDPGETTGYSIFSYGELFKHGITNWEIPVLGYNYLLDIVKADFPNVVVCEDYRLYANRVNAQLGSQIPTIKIIGAIEYVCSQQRIRVIKVMASTAKGFVTNDKLKEWGFYQVGKPHANDALRVGLHILLFSREL